ncbi:MAG: PfaD family polyunsaturated fatty acid/polyketide biosynthesis protein, partial [Bryobacteraceae bacterium]
ISMPYICGEMANGIATTDMVVEIGRTGMLGFFGAAGLALDRIEKSLADLETRCRDFSWGSNLIHSPHDSALEEKTAELYLRHRVTRVSASAFMAVRPSIVRYAYSGVRQNPDGSIERRNHVFAKLSRPEVAKQFMSPAPEAMVRRLVEQGLLTQAEAALAAHLAVAEDITVEADSGGHTDNRPLVALLPAVLSTREEVLSQYRYPRPVRVGAAGGVGTPSAVAAAFSLGAAYVLTGSINQSARESGLSEEGKKMVAQAGLADVMMAPAGDMFEMGVKVQVLKRGTLFGVRGAKLYDLYSRYESLEQIPATVMASLEKDIFQRPIEDVWAETRQYFLAAKPEEVTRALKESKHRMALVFRWYLGLSSRWAIQGDPGRRFDYQIWCGPAMGAFNQWVAGSFLDDIANRGVSQIALNLMHGATSVARAQQLRAFGVDVQQSAYHFRPREFALPDTRAGAHA